MELRDVIGILVGLDDERRVLSGELSSALDQLDRAATSDERLGVGSDRTAALREGISLGSDESTELREIGETLAASLLVAVRAPAEQDAHGLDEPADQADAGGDALARVIERAREAWEAIGQARQLLARRSDIDAQVRSLKEPFLADAEALELLDVALAAGRHGGKDPAQRDAASILAAAEDAAKADGQLAGIASNARALRDAISAGRDPTRIAADLARRIVSVTLRTARERDDERRRIAALTRDLERHQSVAQGLAQAARKASEVILRAARFGRLPPAEQLASGALGPLKAACLEHGIISMMLGLRELRIDRVDFDRSLSEVSSALGTLLSLVEERPDLVERIVPAWDDLAAVDARTMEPDWQAALWDVVGLQADRLGTLAVAPERLARLALADSLEPWRRSLLERIETKTEDVLRATHRLETLDGAMTDIVEGGGERAAAAIAVKAALTQFVGEALHLMGDCHDRIRERLLRPDTGFALVADRVAPFIHLEDLASDATEEDRAAAVAATLADIRALFTRLRSATDGQAGPDGERWREANAHLREEAAEAHRRLAATLARARRLRQLTLAPLPRTVEDAIAMAASLREAPAGSSPPGLRDRLGEALEALHLEREFHSLVTLPSGGEVPALRALATRRGRRLMDLHGASLTLIFRLLQALGAEHERLDGPDRDAHFEWIEELLAHAEREMNAYMAVLDECLLDLPGNADRLDRHAVAFDSYHAWARSVAETELGMELVGRHGARFFERFENPLGHVGAALVDSIRPDASDWRASGALESVMDLQASLLGRLATRPTLTDLAGRIGALRERAERLRDEVVARAEANDPFARGGGGRLGG